MNRKIAWIWALAFLSLAVYMVVIAGSLPETLAVHFDLAGKPNGFQSKLGFVVMMFCFSFFVNGIFFALFSFIDRLPQENINIPWKKYWFSTPERKTEAFERLRTVLALGGIFVCATFLFTEHIVYQENTPNASFTIPVTAGVGLILILAVIFLTLSFLIAKPPAQE